MGTSNDIASESPGTVASRVGCYSKELIYNPTREPPGMDMNRLEWSRSNRIRTLQGRYGHLLNCWKMKSNPRGDCGHEDQTRPHIISEMSASKIRRQYN
ncbi:unnamed protein product [Soboliphyme baturini]|uniref:Uncharacterized protein n=1 Tax=Soboliphyme baturini TaxID=241478 RepID=A0A183JAE3_9BILA|nr:unnamed protein product [Soboliphyme baturini]